LLDKEVDQDTYLYMPRRVVLVHQLEVHSEGRSRYQSMTIKDIPHRRSKSLYPTYVVLVVLHAKQCPRVCNVVFTTN
jgi:hypothetical protein